MLKSNIQKGTSGYSRSLPYQNYKSLFTLAEGDEEITEDPDETRALKVNEAKKKPTTKKGKEKKFKKVMGEFGKGELKPYHAKKTLKSKKQDGSKKDHKQALAIAFSEAGMKKESMNEINKVALQHDLRFQQYFQVTYSELIKRGLTSDEIGELFDDRENKNTLYVMYDQDFYPTKWLDNLDYSMLASDIAQPFHENVSIFKSKNNKEAVIAAIEKEFQINKHTLEPTIPSRELRVIKNVLEKGEELDKHHKKYYLKLLKLYEFPSDWALSESSSVAVGYYSGGMITPRSQKNAAKREKMEKFKDATEPEGEHGEVEEEMVHPDDKIGNMMLKKMDVPQPFTSNKKGEVHQKKVDK